MRGAKGEEEDGKDEQKEQEEEEEDPAVRFGRLAAGEDRDAAELLEARSTGVVRLGAGDGLMPLLGRCLVDSPDDTVRRRALEVLDTLAKRDEAPPESATFPGSAKRHEWDAFAGCAQQGHYWECCLEGLRRPQLTGAAPMRVGDAAKLALWLAHGEGATDQGLGEDPRDEDEDSGADSVGAPRHGRSLAGTSENASEGQLGAPGGVELVRRDMHARALELIWCGLVGDEEAARVGRRAVRLEESKSTASSSS